MGNVRIMAVKDYLIDKIQRTLALERDVVGAVEQARIRLADCIPAASVLGAISDELLDRPPELERAIRDVGGEDAVVVATGEGARSSESVSPSIYLESLHGRLQETALAAATVHAAAHRAYKSTGEGNLADLAEAHHLAFLTAGAKVGEAISEVAVWELERAGDECECRCPSCSVGICLCARHGKETVATSRTRAAERPSEQGIAARLPRQGSLAAMAGLRLGDVIIAAGGREVSGPSDLQSAIRQSPPDADIALTIKRGETTEDMILKRSVSA
jgi:hypothetical protein